MSLWGTGTGGDEAKPKYLSDTEKKKTYADKTGWVYERPDGTKEILVAAGSLSDSLAGATINSIEFVGTNVTEALEGQVKVIFNEEVVVAGTTGDLTIPLTATTAGALTAAYTAGTGTNQLTFDFTAPDAPDTISVTGTTLTKGSATLKDKDGDLADSGITYTAGMATGAGTMTVDAA